MDYGKALKIARAIKDIQQAEVAVKADLDPSYICMLEKGKRKPSLGTIERLSGALGIPTHLFSLLATEEKDLKNTDAGEMARVGESLARLVLIDAPKKRKTGRRKSPDPST